MLRKGKEQRFLLFDGSVTKITVEAALLTPGVSVDTNGFIPNKAGTVLIHDRSGGENKGMEKNSLDSNEGSDEVQFVLGCFIQEFSNGFVMTIVDVNDIVNGDAIGGVVREVIIRSPITLRKKRLLLISVSPSRT